MTKKVRMGIWSQERGLWENPNGTVDLFSEQSEPFSGTWPISGMTRDGVAFELPMREPLMVGSEFSFSPGPGWLFSTPDTMPEAPNTAGGRFTTRLRGLGNQASDLLAPATPRASSAEMLLLGTPTSYEQRGAVENNQGQGSLLSMQAKVISEQVLPTPTAHDSGATRTMHKGGNLTLQGAVGGVNPKDWARLKPGQPLPDPLLPTPVGSDANGAAKDEGSRGYGVQLRAIGHLLPTPTVSDGNGIAKDEIERGYRQLRAIEQLLPTPGVAGQGKTIPEDATWSGKAAYKPDGTKVQVNLDRISMLLPTPTTQDGKNSAPPSQFRRNSLPLNALVTTLLPTPEAKLASSGPDYSRENRTNSGGDDLTTTIAKLLPTPLASDGEARDKHRQGGIDLPSTISLLPTPTVDDSSNVTRDSGSFQSLTRTVGQLPTGANLLPTPTAQDSAASGGSTPANVTLTDAVVRKSLGAHMSPRFDDGSLF